MSVNAAAKFVYEDSAKMITVNRAYDVYRNRTPSARTKPAKPLKKQTKEEVKFQLEDSAKMISTRRATRVYQNRLPSPRGELPKPLKKQTKEEVKFQLEEVAKEIKAGNVSDDDCGDPNPEKPP